MGSAIFGRPAPAVPIMSAMVAPYRVPLGSGRFLMRRGSAFLWAPDPASLSAAAVPP
jgi:hypothetical protein